MASEGWNRQDTLPERELIIDAAFELFASDGIRQTTLATVAERAELGEDDVRQHFDDVDQLLLAVLERMDSSFLEAENYMASAPFSALETLRRLATTAKVLVERPQHARMRVVVSFEAIVREGAARTYTQERTESLRWWFSAALNEGIRIGELNPDTDPDARAAEWVAFMEGIQIQWLLHPERIDLVRAYESYIDDLIDQIQAPDDEDS
ncbi:MAG TPA: TetR family transcriptional regulator C-terminal domain-containing protein [Acidimicrobiales bacterium]|nr:TetR family transcriptional regulator C-terminal domain-containing protein [Acidimicrobiales bacterium]